MSSVAPSSARVPRVASPVAALLDAALVLVFAVVGRASHDEGNLVTGTLLTALPFLAGTGAGWALVRVRSKRWPLTFGTGIPVWAATLLVGMLLRALTGTGTAPSFVLVAAAILAALLLGWRLVADRLADRGP